MQLVHFKIKETPETNVGQYTRFWYLSQMGKVTAVHIKWDWNSTFKETESATMNIFENFYFLFKSFVKVELSYVFTIILFTIAENCTGK